MPKATSTPNGGTTRTTSTAADRKVKSAERKATKLVEAARQEASRVRAEAKADADRIRSEAEEHARRLIVDAKATADGVRAEGMDVVSDLRQMGDALREVSDRLLEDVEEIHARMVGELGQAKGDGAGTDREPPVPEPPAEGEESLEVPDFVARGS